MAGILEYDHLALEVLLGYVSVFGLPTQTVDSMDQLYGQIQGTEYRDRL